MEKNKNAATGYDDGYGVGCNDGYDDGYGDGCNDGYVGAKRNGDGKNAGDRINWNAVMNDYLRSRSSYKEIAKRHGISLSAVEKRGRLGGWARARRKTRFRLLSDPTVPVSSDIPDADRVRDAAVSLLTKISDGISNGDISVSGTNMKQLTGAVRDIMDILGVLTPAEEAERAAKLDRLRGETSEATVSVILGDAEEWSE